MASRITGSPKPPPRSVDLEPAAQPKNVKIELPKKSFAEMFEEDHFEAKPHTTPKQHLNTAHIEDIELHLPRTEEHFAGDGKKVFTVGEMMRDSAKARAAFSATKAGAKAVSTADDIINDIAAAGGAHQILPEAVSHAASIGGAVVSLGTTAKSIWDANKVGTAIENTRKNIESLDFHVSNEPPNEAHLTHSQRNPTEGTLLETTKDTLRFAIEKMGRRQFRLGVQAAGGTIATVGGAMTAAGALGAGIGAIPGAVTSAAGGVVRSAPAVYAAGRALTKENKGVTRESSANFLWGLALRKAVLDSRRELEDLGETTAIEASIRSNPKAREAYTLANKWVIADPSAADDAQEAAADFLRDTGVIHLGKPDGKSYELKLSEFVAKGHQMLMDRLKSTP